MSAEYISTTYPTVELTEEQLTYASNEFARRASNGEQILSSEHPLRKIGEKVLHVIANDELLTNSGTPNSPRTLVTGFQVYQDFSALVNPNAALSEWAIGHSAEGIIEEYRRNGYKETVTRSIEIYERSLPLTSQYLAYVANHVKLQPEDFVAGVGLAHKLERNAQYLDHIASNLE